MPARGPVGVIYGDVGATGFEIAVSDPSLRRLDYVEVEHEGQRILCQVGETERRSTLSFEQALAGPGAAGDDRLSAEVHVLGYLDERGRVQPPRTPFRAGTAVHAADEALVTAVLGLTTQAGEGAFLGVVKNSRVPVHLNLNALAQKHVSVLAKTGAGKSYTVGVVLEEFLKAEVPLVVLDPHGEYGSLRHANMDDQELGIMGRFRIRPRSFAKQVKEYAIDTFLNPDAERLRLEGINLEGHEVADLLGGRLSGGQMGVLYQAVKELKEARPAYTLRDIADKVQENKSSAKWNVINALEALASTGVFDVRGTAVKDLVRPGQCTIVNLKGVPPDVQEIVVTRLTNLLWEARKRNDVPAHILVVEEAHNFCPERGIGNAVSGQVLRTVASEGRKFGMGLVIVSQRPAKVDKNVVSQCNTQIVLQVTNPNDVKAVVASVEGITSAGAEEVQRLPVGVALVAGGGLTQPVFVEVRPRHTRHGGRSVAVVGPEADEEPEAPDEDDALEIPDADDEADGDADDEAPEDDVEETPTAAKPAPAAAEAPRPPAPRRLKGEAHPVFTGPTTPRARPPPAPPVPPVAVAPGPPPASPAASVAPAGPAGPAAGHGPPAPPPGSAPPARPAAKPAAKAWGKEDKALVHRVASRVGLVGAEQKPDHAVSVVRRLAAGEGEDPEARVALYREIAAHVCHAETPGCIRCPLQAGCEFHARLVAERKKTRSPIRRLWRR